MRHKTYSLLLAGILTIYILLRVPSLTLLPVFCDEATYIHWAQLIQANPLHAAFVPLTDGKTLLFMWLAAPLQSFFSDPLFAGRLLSVLAGLATVLGATVLGKKFFSPRVGLIAALLLSVVPFTVFFDKLALTDSLLAAFSFWSLILALSLVQKFTANKMLLLGLTLGGGILVKTPGIFSFITLPLAVLSVRKSFKSAIGLAGSAVIGLGVYNLLRFSPQFANLASRNPDYYFPVSRILQTPLNPFIPHLKDLADWLPKLLTWPVLIFVAVSIVLIISKRNLVSLVIFLWGMLPLLAMTLLLKTFTARYVLFSIVPLIFLASWTIDVLANILPSKRQAISLLVFIILLLTPALFFDYYLATNPQNAPLPAQERRGYLEDWTAGYGLKEVAGFLTSLAEDQKILVVTEGFIGTLPDGLQIYLPSDTPHIEIWYSTAVLDSDVYATAKTKPTYFVVNKSHLAFNPNLKLIKEYPRAPGPVLPLDALQLYQVLP